MSAVETEDLLYHCGGLLGVSGISSDMQVLLDNNDRQAREVASGVDADRAGIEPDPRL